MLYRGIPNMYVRIAYVRMYVRIAYVRMYVCMYVCMYVHMDGWMDGWIGGWADGCMYVHIMHALCVPMCILAYIYISTIQFSTYVHTYEHNISYYTGSYCYYG